MKGIRQGSRRVALVAALLACFGAVQAADFPYDTIGTHDLTGKRVFKIAYWTQRSPLFDPGFLFWEKHVNDHYGEKEGLWSGGEPYMIETQWIDVEPADPAAPLSPQNVPTTEFLRAGVQQMRDAGSRLAILGVDFFAVQELSKELEDAGFNHFVSIGSSAGFFKSNSRDFLWGIMVDNALYALNFLSYSKSKGAGSACLVKNGAYFFPTILMNGIRARLEAEQITVLLDETVDVSAEPDPAALIAGKARAIADAGCDIVLVGEADGGDVGWRVQLALAQEEVPLQAVMVTSAPLQADWDQMTSAEGLRLGDSVFAPTQWHPTERYFCPIYGSTASFATLYEDWQQAGTGARVAPNFQQAVFAAAGVVAQLALNSSWFAAPGSCLDPDHQAFGYRLRKAIGDSNVETFFGTMRFNRYGQNFGKEPLTVQVFDGEPVAVLPLISASAAVKFPMPSFESIFGCPEGTFNREGQCDACPVQHFSDALGATSCTLCAAGSEAQRGSSACAACAAGRFRVASSTQSCEACAVGSAQRAAGSSTCDACPAGSFADAQGLEACAPCAPGTFGVAEGDGSTCAACPEGRFAEAGGSTGCQPCAENFYAAAGAEACAACPSGRVTLSEGASTQAQCVCARGSFEEDEACLDCGQPWMTTDNAGAKSSSACRWDTPFYLLVFGLVAVVLFAGIFIVAYRRLQRYHEAKMERVLEEKLLQGLDSVNSLQHPLVLIACDSFMKSPLDFIRGLHETYRNLGYLVYLDTVNTVAAFKGMRGTRFVLFFSYQWLSWDVAGPDSVQFQAMKTGATKIMSSLNLTLEQMYIWLDIVSIPQKNAALKGLAVNSLYTYARQADGFIIVAPESKHANLNIDANVQTYKRRVWTRAEQVSFFCCRGLKQMYLMTEEYGNVPADWMDDVAALFEGDMTCCSKKHLGGAPCDKESLVLPMLGMYCDLVLTSVPSDHMKFVHQLIQKQKGRVFPKTHGYVTEKGAVVQKELFGDSIARLDRLLEGKTDFMTRFRATRSTHEMRTAASHGTHSACHDNSTQLVVPYGAPHRMLQDAAELGWTEPDAWPVDVAPETPDALRLVSSFEC